MGFMWLSNGVAGALQAAAIAALLGVALSVAGHALARFVGWREGTAIGVAFALTLLFGAGVDAWNLFYLSIVRLESPFAIRETLATIHDPGSLGTRVVFEFIGASGGVMLGWWLWELGARARPPRD